MYIQITFEVSKEKTYGMSLSFSNEQIINHNTQPFLDAAIKKLNREFPNGYKIIGIKIA